ncbi:MAG: hypothetical protein A2754_02200 [Candidatus Magasanikbacteria bacterium RIFCSPHIGHO2_01_FULL_47_8]|uniref:SHS2 domain-containing protein n=1 Tax=Candidatus Magasanikbacteria bacterium RIFCSPHIGHO2_01_FULL_47_8 TaxID=1798673 RepID=A0A1F6MDU9_9BACT|nr:MAG: hypothetical protein A2754_02200 [Candidatus Magasanikbacteria bacterium RIFCSPHIGHO2_01_FULL_47_8]
MWFDSKKNKILGIDIGTSSVKIVELTKSGDKIELTNYGQFVDFRGQLQSTTLQVLSSQVGDVIKGIVQEAGMKERSAAIAVPMFSGFTTVITMPSIPDEELSQAVTYEAKKYIPLPLGEVKFEWSKLDNNPAAEKGTMDLLIVAVTNELINRYQEAAKLSNIDLRYIELDAFSLARALVGPSDGPTLIIDIGALSTALIIVDKEWPMYTRTSEVAGREFTKLLARSLGTDFKRAESLKYKIGVHSAGGIILPLVDSLLAEAKRIIDDYAKARKMAIQRVILSGGSSNTPGLLEYAVKALGKETVIANPFRDIIYPRELEPVIQKMAPAYCIAVGLALREFK